MSETLSDRLARWSQRKTAARRGAAVDAAETAAVPPDASESELPPLPSIDDLDAASDYTVFLGKSVPEELTRAALRKLWRSDPVLANLDGLNNYDEDYNVVDRAITLSDTSYRAGLGYVDDVRETLAELDEQLGESPPSRPSADPEPPADEEAAHAGAEGAAELSAPDAAAQPEQVAIELGALRDRDPSAA